MANKSELGANKDPQKTNFQQLNFLEFQFFVTLSIIFIPMGIIVNILIIYAFSQKRLNVPKQHRYYYILVAIADLLAIIGRQLLLLFLGIGLYALSGYSIKYYFSTFSLFHCLFSYNMWAFGEMVSNYTMTVFCIERFISVSFPLHAKSWITFKRVVISHCFVVIPLTAYEHFHMIMTHNVVKSSSSVVGVKCGTDASIPEVVIFTWINNVVLKYGHMAIALIFNILLIINIRRASLTRIKLMKNTQSESEISDQVSRAEVSTAIIILLSSFVTIAVWVPQSVFSQIKYVLGNMAVSDPAIKSSTLYTICEKGYEFASSGLVISHVINFWILAFRMRAFRNIILFRSATVSSRQSTSL